MLKLCFVGGSLVMLWFLILIELCCGVLKLVMECNSVVLLLLLGLSSVMILFGLVLKVMFFSILSLLKLWLSDLMCRNVLVMGFDFEFFGFRLLFIWYYVFWWDFSWFFCWWVCWVCVYFMVVEMLFWCWCVLVGGRFDLLLVLRFFYFLIIWWRFLWFFVWVFDWLVLLNWWWLVYCLLGSESWLEYCGWWVIGCLLFFRWWLGFFGEWVFCVVVLDCVCIFWFESWVSVGSFIWFFYCFLWLLCEWVFYWRLCVLCCWWVDCGWLFCWFIVCWVDCFSWWVFFLLKWFCDWRWEVVVCGRVWWSGFLDFLFGFWWYCFMMVWRFVVIFFWWCVKIVWLDCWIRWLFVGWCVLSGCGCRFFVSLCWVSGCWFLGLLFCRCFLLVVVGCDCVVSRWWLLCGCYCKWIR